MSFNAKNLSYGMCVKRSHLALTASLTCHLDSREPSFLRKLKSEYGSSNSDRRERPATRPRKPKGAAEDDEPIYVDETNNETIPKAEYEEMLKPLTDFAIVDGDKHGSTQDGVLESQIESNHQSIENGLTKEQRVAIGAAAKRRIAKVIGEDEHQGGLRIEGEPAAKEIRSKKPKKKIKLSFDESNAF